MPFAAPASAQQYYTGPTSTLPTSPTTVPGLPPARVVRVSNLAFTGADVAQLAGLGALAIGTGAILVRRGRRPVPVKPGGEGAQ